MEESDALLYVLECPIFEYQHYRGLWIQELWAIEAYIDRNNKDSLASLISNNAHLSPGMREFLADFIAGNITRPSRKAPCKFDRDFDIYHAIIDLIDTGLTRDCAIETLETSKRFTTHEGRNALKFDALLKIYKDFNKQFKKL